MHERIYVCHTFYHAYVACLKELHILHQTAREGAMSGTGESAASFGKAGNGSEAAGRATLVLSRMSNQFGSMIERARESGLFEAVVEYDEKEDTFFDELAPLRRDTGNIARNMMNRIRFCKHFADLQEAFVPVDFKDYQDIYVFCDSDPIGYYLNGKHIPYHAVEDGLDTVQYSDDARISNKGHFGLKAFMARLGLIHMQNGYSRYCIDMEVNQLEGIKYPLPNMVECPREALVQELAESDKALLLQIFVANLEDLKERLAKGQDRPRVLILTDPLCDLATRERIFRDIIETYGEVDGERALVLLKQHPRDYLSYEKLFPEVVHLDGTFPMEMLGFIPDLQLARVVSVYTNVDSIHFAREKVFLGHDFMDRYEDPKIHRVNEDI